MQYYSYPFKEFGRLEAGMAPMAEPSFPVPQVPLSGTPLFSDEMIDVQEPAAPAVPLMPAAPVQETMMPGVSPGCPFMPFDWQHPGFFIPQQQMGTSPGGQSSRQPQPILSNPAPTVAIALFKELTGYPNYGNPSGNADILYTGTRGVWTFVVPAFLFIPGNLRAQIVIRAVLDDHTAVPVSNYSARITINGTVVHNGRLALPHGAPAGGRFNNWRQLTFNVPNFRRTNQVVIENTSSAGPNDWIAFDWMELRISTG